MPLLPCAPTAAGTRLPRRVWRPRSGRRAVGGTVIHRVDPGPTAFGLVGDAEPGDPGQVFVLDVMERRVGAATGAEPVAWTGRPGRGPGELFIPVALAAGRNGMLYVLDRGNQRIEAYAARGAALRRTGSIPLPFVPEDLCTLGDRIFVLGAYRERAIHELDPGTGAVLSSFAPDPQLRDDLLATFRTGGYLACGPGDEITFLPTLRPVVERFSARTGAFLGSADIPGYRAVAVRRTGEGVTFSAPGGVHDRAASITPLPDGRLLLQVGQLRPGAATPHEFTEIRTYLLSWPDGGIRPLADDLHRITAAADGWALAVGTDPAPSVHRIALTLPPPSAP